MRKRSPWAVPLLAALSNKRQTRDAVARLRSGPGATFTLGLTAQEARAHLRACGLSWSAIRNLERKGNQ